jgi:hypothetical protein
LRNVKAPSSVFLRSFYADMTPYFSLKKKLYFDFFLFFLLKKKKKKTKEEYVTLLRGYHVAKIKH